MSSPTPTASRPPDANTAAPIVDGAAFSFSNVADAPCSPLRGTTAHVPGMHSDPVVFNSLLQNYGGRRSWGDEQPAALLTPGQAREFNQGVV